LDVSGVISSVEAGAGVAIATEAFSHAFGHRVKLCDSHLNQRRFPSVSPRQKGDLVQPPKSFGNARNKSLRKNDLHTFQRALDFHLTARLQ
jgi:hypothetical protein